MNDSEVLSRIIQQRRSIRKFKADPLPRALIESIVADGYWAPSGKNLQNWRFFVATGEKRDAYLKLSQKSWLNLKDILQARLKPSLYQFTERFFFTLGDAPAIIFCYSKNEPHEKHLTSVGSVYMAVQNILLSAQARGVGTCAMGAPLEIKADVDKFVGEDKVKDLELLCAIAMGWPDHAPPAAPRQTEGRLQFL